MKKTTKYALLVASALAVAASAQANMSMVTCWSASPAVLGLHL